MPLGLGLGITKLKSLVSGLRVRFQGNATITAALDGILRDLSADFVSNGTVTAALEAIKLLDVDFSGDGTLTGDLADYAYLLDDYSGAAAAYSIRLLSSTYSGALVEIRRSSDNALKSFYPDSNNELSLNSEDGSSTSLSSWIGSDNGFVRTIYDQSGNSLDMVQTSASNQGQIITSGSLITINSKAAILGANSYYQANVTSSSTFTKLDVYKYANAPASNEAVYGLCDGGNNNRFELRQDGTNLEFFIRENGGAFVQPAIKAQDTNQNLLISYYNNGTVDAYVNNTEELNNYNTGLSNPNYTKLVLMAIDASGIFFNLDGYIQESVLWSNYGISNNEAIATNVNDFYSIY